MSNNPYITAADEMVYDAQCEVDNLRLEVIDEVLKLTKQHKQENPDITRGDLDIFVYETAYLEVAKLEDEIGGAVQIACDDENDYTDEVSIFDGEEIYNEAMRVLDGQRI